MFHLQEMRHFEALQDKVVQMEKKQKQRESELRHVIGQAPMGMQEMTSQLVSARRQLDEKNQEILKFRKELDSILEVLRELRRQGVVLPPYRDTGR